MPSAAGAGSGPCNPVYRGGCPDKTNLYIHRKTRKTVTGKFRADKKPFSRGVIRHMADAADVGEAGSGGPVDPSGYCRIAVICGLVTAGTGLLGIIGLYLSLPLFSGTLYGYKPISFSAALIWIIFGLALVGMGSKRLHGLVRIAMAGAIGFIIVFQLISLPFSLTGNLSFLDGLSVRMSSALLGVPTTPLSPVTSVLVVPAALGLLVLLTEPDLAKRYPRVRGVTGIIGSIVTSLSFLFALSYLYGTPFFSGTQIIPITLPSSFALCILGLGLAAAAGPSAPPLKYFTGTSAHARLLKAFIPLTLAIVISEEMLQIVLSAYADVNDALISALALGIFTLVTIIVVGSVAREVGRAIDQADLRRKETEIELRAAYEQLAAQEEELRHQYDRLAENQEIIRQNGEQYRTILRTAMDGFCLVGTTGAFVDVNDAFCTMLGYTREEILRLTLRDIEVKETPEDISLHMQEIIRKGSDRFQTRYRCRDGRIIDVEVSVVYTGSSGAPFFTFHRDVTEQVRAESALGQAKKKLNLLNLVTFNDIQNAIFSMTGYLQLVRTGQTDERMIRFTDKEEEIVHKISDTLQFAHSYQDMGMKPPRWQRVGPVFLLAISHLDFSRIRHRIETDNLEIFADPLLEQVFQILANNSLRHGGSVSEVSLSFFEEQDGLRIIYGDNGSGIPEDLKGSLFTRDFLKKKGTGLFLAREILEITGISIRETGTSGNGARFELYVPREAYRFRRGQEPENPGGAATPVSPV